MSAHGYRSTTGTMSDESYFERIFTDIKSVILHYPDPAGWRRSRSDLIKRWILNVLRTAFENPGNSRDVSFPSDSLLYSQYSLSQLSSIFEVHSSDYDGSEEDNDNETLSHSLTSSSTDSSDLDATHNPSIIELSSSSNDHDNSSVFETAINGSDIETSSHVENVEPAHEEMSLLEDSDTHYESAHSSLPQHMEALRISEVSSKRWNISKDFQTGIKAKVLKNKDKMLKTLESPKLRSCFTEENIQDPDTYTKMVRIAFDNSLSPEEEKELKEYLAFSLTGKFGRANGVFKEFMTQLVKTHKNSCATCGTKRANSC